MQYQVIGDLSAPVFFSINIDTGRIAVRSNLRQDQAMQYLVILLNSHYYLFFCHSVDSIIFLKGVDDMHFSSLEFRCWNLDKNWKQFV